MSKNKIQVPEAKQAMVTTVTLQRSKPEVSAVKWLKK